MGSFKFIHAADLHIDSPLRGLEQYEGAPVDQLRGATRDAFHNLVTRAIDERVAFVVLAGDLFDGEWPDTQTGLWTAGQFRRLERTGIRVFYIRGNHDAASKVRSAVTWPANVRELSVRSPETVQDDVLGVAIHGQGFARAQCPEDLAADYPPAIPGLFNIGVLHTSLTGSAEHDVYAPTREDVLQQHGYDYWALGHIHQRSDPPLGTRPFVAYSGNTQGRHIRETGAKGCLLASVVDGELESVQFVETGTLRWERVVIELSEEDGIPELLAAAERGLKDAYRRAEERLLAVRVTIRGACRAHAQLAHKTARDEVLAEIRNLANAMNDEVWIEKLELRTRTRIDLDQLRQGSDLVGELLQTIARLREDDDELCVLARELAPLTDKAGLPLKEAGLEIDDPAQLRRWLADAESILVAGLLEGDA